MDSTAAVDQFISPIRSKASEDPAVLDNSLIQSVPFHVEGLCNAKCFWNHLEPDPETSYFTSGGPADSQQQFEKNYKEKSSKEHMLVCVPVYNEQAREVYQTLESIYQQSLEMEGMKVSVCCILDGYAMASSSLKQFIAGIMGTSAVFENIGMAQRTGSPNLKDREPASPRTILKPSPSFGTCSSGITEVESFSDITSISHFTSDIIKTLDAMAAAGVAGTVILENIDMESQQVVPMLIAPGKWMDITVIVKLDNRRKHNSHQWFLAGFGKAHATADYLFMTDSGTWFSPGCLSKLTALIRENPNEYCAAVAFQRPVVPPEGTLASMYYGYAQWYEFYLTNYCCSAAFALLGFQPVIPGPCQLFTASAGLNPEFQRSYFAVGDASAQSDFIGKTQLLAEDRFFTNYLYTVTQQKIGFVPSAVFHYELTVAPDQFLAQRRRWVNGTMAASIRLILDYKDWSKNMKASSARQVFGLMLVLCIQMFIALLTPGIIAGGVFQAFSTSYNNEWLGYSEFYYAQLDWRSVAIGASVLAIYILAHFAFIVAHHKKSYSRKLNNLNVLLNILSVALLFIFAYKQLHFLLGDAFSMLVMVTTFLTFVFPSIISILIRDWAGLVYGTVCFLPYLLFRANFCLAVSFGVAQSWNLSWGTRPNDPKSQSSKEYEKAMVKLYRTSRLLMIAYMLMNLGVAAVVAMLVRTYETETLLVVCIAFLLPSFVWYPFGAAFFIKYMFAKYLRANKPGIMRRVSYLKRAVTKPSFRMLLAAMMILTQLASLIGYQYMMYDRSERKPTVLTADTLVPYPQKVQQCSTFACLQQAHATSNLGSVQFTFPHALLVGWQDTQIYDLNHFLEAHPQSIKRANATTLVASELHEAEFFTLQCKADPINGCSHASQKKYITNTLSRDEYARMNGQGMAYEVSSHYGMNGEHIAHGIKQALPYVKVIAVLREPISRALSRLKSMADDAKEGCLVRESYDLYECLKYESQLAPRRGHYNYIDANDPSLLKAVSHWVQNFPADQFKVLQFEELFGAETQKPVLNDLEDFLGLDPLSDAPHYEPELIEYDFAISRDKYLKLIEHVRPEAIEVAELLESGGYVNNSATWMSNWERIWNSNLDRCESEICHLELV